MKPPIPMPVMSSASSTLTAAMMPSSRFVVPSSPAMAPSERRQLARRRVARRLRRVAERVVQQLPAFVGHARGLLNGGPEAHELAREIIQRRLDLAPQGAAVLGEKQASGGAANDRSNQCGRQCARVVHQASYQKARIYKLHATPSP